MLTLRTTQRALSLAAAAACACMGAPALAQTAPAAPAKPASAPEAEATKIETVTVTGFRQAVETSLNMKRDADGFVDAISADALGRFPDLNVGEALTRIPGIQINREGNDRTGTVNLRGLPSSFATVTLNGLPFADPALSGGTPLGVFSSDVFTAFVVRKSPSASDKAGGLSGNIDLQIQGALARKDGRSVKLGLEYNELGGGKAPSVNVTVNQHFGKDFAVYAALTAKKDHFRRDTIQPNVFAQLNAGNATFVRSVAVPASGGNPALPAVGASLGATTNLAAFADYYAAPGTALEPGDVILNVPAANTADGKAIVGTGLKSKKGVLMVREMRRGLRDFEADMLTAAAGAEFRAAPDLILGANIFHTGRKSVTRADQWIAGIGGQTHALVTADPASVMTTPVGTNYVNNFSFANGSLNSSSRVEWQNNETSGVSGRISWSPGDWRLVTDVNASKAEGYYNQLGVGTIKNSANITAANPVGNGTSGTFRFGEGRVGDMAMTWAGPANTVPGGTLNLAGVTTTGATANINNPNAIAALNLEQVQGTTGDRLQLTGLNTLSENKVNAIQQTFERNLHDLPFTSIKAGLRYEQNKFKATTYVQSPYGINAAGMSSLAVNDNEFAGSFFGGKSSLNSTYWPTLDRGLVEANLKPTPESLVPGQALTPRGYPVLLTPDGWVNNSNGSSYLTGNFTNDYAITSAFVMGNFDTTVLGMPLRGNLGLRHETLKKSIQTLERTALPGQAPRFDLRQFDSTYKKSLPSFMAALEPMHNVVVRYAAYETYVAPNRKDENPVSSVSVSRATTGTLATNWTVNLGKKDLTPYTATSHDLGLEWYNRKGSVLAMNLFRKNINGYTYAISNLTDPDLTCPSSGLYNGLDYGIGALRPFDPAAASGQGCRAVNDDLSTGVAQPVYVNATGAKNNPNKIKVTGIELTAQQNLSFLPAPWNNFGGQANYSVTKIDGTYPNGSTVKLDGVSKDSYNLIGFYETADYGVRLIYNHRSKYELPGGQTFTGAPRTSKARGTMDFSATYNFGNGMTLSLDGFNITNELREDYDDADERVLRKSDYDGRTYRLTFRSRF